MELEEDVIKYLGNLGIEKRLGKMIAVIINERDNPQPGPEPPMPENIRLPHLFSVNLCINIKRVRDMEGDLITTMSPIFSMGYNV